MTRPANTSLSKDKIQQLLAAVGANSAKNISEDIETTDYNWFQPHYFSRDQLNQLNLFMEKLVLECAAKFTQLYRNDFVAEMISTTQCFAGDIFNRKDEQTETDYYIAFGPDKNQPVGLIGIPLKSAMAWTTQILGETGDIEEVARKLSPLEESLLTDIASSLIDAFAVAYGSRNFSMINGITMGRLPIELQGAAELCEIKFKTGKADSNEGCRGYFLIFCEKLNSVAGKNPQAAASVPDKDVAKAIQENLSELPVEITIELGQTRFNFGRIMDLQAGDILMLDKRIDEPAGFIVGGKTVFRGMPAQSGGKYAAVVTEICNKK
jgi:flagellar motor switch protein FliM